LASYIKAVRDQNKMKFFSLPKKISQCVFSLCDNKVNAGHNLTDYSDKTMAQDEAEAEGIQ
jgi:hypothetical protein